MQKKWLRKLVARYILLEHIKQKENKMAYELKNNTFSLFENDKKGNDKSPDWRGKALIGGKEMRIAVWKRKSASGIEYLSGSIEEPFKPATEPAKEEPAKELLDETIPF